MTAYVCENCERPFCHNCDEDSVVCLQCARPYCGWCVTVGETCSCPLDED